MSVPRDVVDDDDRPHAMGPDLLWSETYAFAGVDPGSGLGWLARAEVSPNQGFLQVDLSCLLPDGGFIAARHVKSLATSSEDLEVEGLRFTMEEPLSRWRVSYDGPAHSLGSARDATRRDAWSRSRLERLIVDLTFVTEMAPCAPACELGRATLGEGGFAQPGAVRGELWVSGDRYDLEAYGSRVKAWGAGPPLRSGRRFALGFDDGSALVLERLVLDGGTVERGALWRAGHPTALVGCAIDEETDAESGLVRKLGLAFDGGDGRRHEVGGELLRGVALPVPRGAGTSLLGQSFVRALWEGRRGYGTATTLGDVAVPSAQKL